MRFFPRYYFLLLPVLVLMAARGFMLLGRRRELVALLLLIPADPLRPYLPGRADGNPGWRDIDMDQDSRAVSAVVRKMAQPGDTLFVWGYRPEIFVYTGLPAATMYLDSQPLTGVPADRHLTQFRAGRNAWRRCAAAEQLADSRPTFILDGLGLYNPQLAIAHYPDLQEWLAHYRQVGRTSETVIYRRE